VLRVHGDGSECHLEQPDRNHCCGKVVYALSVMKFCDGRPCAPEISVVGTNGKGWKVGRINGTEGAA
jgi:hypothetical protein